MLRGVTPTFFEEGYFDSSNVKQRRLIQNKYIYDISNRYLSGEELPEIFFTNDEGKLGRIGQSNEDSVAPIMPGTYYFFVSKHDLNAHELIRQEILGMLNRENSIEVTVTDQLHQEIILPWPMCYHSYDGARAVAQYILEEIRNNSVSDITRRIYNMNDYEGRMAAHRALPSWQQAFTPPPQPMTWEANIA